MSDPIIRKFSISVDTNDAAAGAEALHETEAAMRDALVELSGKLGDEIVVVRKLDIALFARRTDTVRVLPKLQSRLQTILDARIFGNAADSEAIVRYPSEAHALADYLAAMALGRNSDWPFTAFRHWGTTVEVAMARCCERGALFVADTLSVLCRIARLPTLLPTPIAMRTLNVLDAVGDHASRICIAELPRDVRDRLSLFVTALPETLSDAQWRLNLLGALYDEWPPARGQLIEETTAIAAGDGTEAQRRLVLCEALVAAVATRAAPGSPRSESNAKHGSTRAAVASHGAGLLFWASALPRLGVDLTSIYPTPRIGNAVQWALGRVLQTASLATRDPLLLLWSGEAMDISPAFAPILQSSNAEPLHAAAITLALRLRYLGDCCRIVPLGDEQLAIGEGDILLDAVRCEDVHAAVPLVVRNLRRRAPEVAPTFQVEEDLDSATLDSVSQVDAIFAPDRWCWALRAMASVLRRWLREEMRADLRTLHDWKAALHDETIDLRRSDAERIDRGRWLGDSTVKLGGRKYTVRLI